MLFRYRFKGKVNSQFVLRGMLFRVGSKIDFCVSDKELDFVKTHCSAFEIIDREPPKVVEIPEPMLKEPNTESENKPKGVKNGLQTKSTNTSSKGKHKANI